MKKLFNQSLFLVLILSTLSCKGPTAKGNGNGSASDLTQKITLLVDGTKRTTDPEPVISSSFTSTYFLLGYLSDKDDIQFSLTAYMQDLKIGSYQVYECISVPECTGPVPENIQKALFGPYPKDPMPALNLFRSAYNAPSLGLKPLTLVISSVTDEQQAGNPFKTKRIKGKFNGSLAYVEQQQGGYEHHIVGKTTQIDGEFDVICSMR